MQAGEVGILERSGEQASGNGSQCIEGRIEKKSHKI